MFLERPNRGWYKRRRPLGSDRSWIFPRTTPSSSRTSSSTSHGSAGYPRTRSTHTIATSRSSLTSSRVPSTRSRRRRSSTSGGSSRSRRRSDTRAPRSPGGSARSGRSTDGRSRAASSNGIPPRCSADRSPHRGCPRSSGRPRPRTSWRPPRAQSDPAGACPDACRGGRPAPGPRRPGAPVRLRSSCGRGRRAHARPDRPRP